MEKNKQWLAGCCREIEESVGWGESAGWRNEDFEQLAEKIFNKTGVNLSLSTMKRIWGRVRYDNFPNNATLNALAGFLDYKDWRNFCELHPVNGSATPTSLLMADKIVLPSNAPAKKTGFGRRSVYVVISALVMAGTVALLSAKHYTTTKTVNRYYNYQFSSRKTSDDLPNSVVFSYDAGATKDDKVMIQQNWDTSRRELVDPIGNRHTSIYYYPGYFRARLMVNDSIVKRTPVFIQTKGWKGIAERRPLPVYFSNSDIRQDSGIAISSQQLQKALNITNLTDQWMQFSNFREFPGISGDNFIFEISLRNSSTAEESLCRNIQLILIGTLQPLIIPLTEKGCIAGLDVYTGDTVISGRNHDLSGFGCDFNFMQNLRCESKNKMIYISINGKHVLSFPNHQSLGDIVGLRIRFEGAGEIKTASFSTPGGISYDLMSER